MKDMPPRPTIAWSARAVAVVLEPLPVQVDQRLEVEVGRQDVVGEEAVAVVGGLLGDLRGADRAVPDERRDVVQRARGGGEALQRRPEASLPVHHVLAPQPVQQVVVLQRQRDALADVLAEPRVDRHRVAPADHQVQPALRHVLQHRVVLRDLDRVVGGHQGHRRAQHDPLRQRRDVAEQRRRRRRDERRVVVLAECEHVEPDLVGTLGDPDDVADPLGLAVGVAGRRVRGDVTDGEDSELHDLLLSARSPDA